MTKRDVVFRVSGLKKVYTMGEVRVHALRGIDLELLSGELVVLLGPSGSGKSTLLNILGGLDTATEGRVLSGEEELTNASERELTEYRRHHVGFVFQFYNLIPSLTARENVAVVTGIAINASGIAAYVMLISNMDSLKQTREKFYQEYRFADVFVSVKRAPEGLKERIGEIEGVTGVETRVVADVKLDIKGFPEQVTGKVVSIPDSGRPLLNRLFIRSGRLGDPWKDDEAVVSEVFAEAQGLGVGDSFGAVINGRWKTLTIVGVALSPEFVLQTRPGAISRVSVVEPGGFTKVSSLGVEEQRTLVIADITSLPEEWKRLGDNYRVDASFVIWEGKDVLQIPAGALFRRGNDWAVFVFRDKRAQLRRVQIGHRTGLTAEVVSGLAEGEMVITHPAESIWDGSRVRAREG